MVVGSRIQVWRGTADKTAGGLTKKDLFYEKKTRRIRSKAASRSAKSLNNLGPHKVPKGTHTFMKGGNVVGGRFHAGTKELAERFKLVGGRSSARPGDDDVSLEQLEKRFKKIQESGREPDDDELEKRVDNLYPYMPALEVEEEDEEFNAYRKRLNLQDIPSNIAEAQPKNLDDGIYDAIRDENVDELRRLLQFNPNERRSRLPQYLKTSIALDTGYSTGVLAGTLIRNPRDAEDVVRWWAQNLSTTDHFDIFTTATFQHITDNWNTILLDAGRYDLVVRMNVAIEGYNDD
jgi:hypothetical protein